MFTDLFRGWCAEKPIEIFSRICFGASSSTSTSTDPDRLQNTMAHQRLFRGRRELLRIQYRLMSSFSSLFLLKAVCHICYRELSDTWDRSSTHTLSQTADLFSPRVREVSAKAAPIISFEKSVLAYFVELQLLENNVCTTSDIFIF